MLLIKYWLHDGIYSHVTNEESVCLEGPRVQSSDVTKPSLTAGSAFKKAGEPPSSPSGRLLLQTEAELAKSTLPRCCAWYQVAKVQG